MCSPRSSPMALIIVAEFEATDRPSMRWFQTLLAGKIGQLGAPGTVGAVPGPGFAVGVGVGAAVGVGAGVGTGVGVARGVATGVGVGVGAIVPVEPG